jgi:hypothetical protein
MIVILGLIILIAAVVVGVAGVVTNHGNAHTLIHGFSLFGYHVTGTGTLFLDGIVVGAVAMFGLSLVLSGARRTSRRGSDARRGLEQSHDETVAVREDRNDLIVQREAARADTTSALINGSRPGDGTLNPVDGRPSRRHLIGHRAAAEDTTTTTTTLADSSTGQRGV